MGPQGALATVTVTAGSKEKDPLAEMRRVRGPSLAPAGRLPISCRDLNHGQPCMGGRPLHSTNTEQGEGPARGDAAKVGQEGEGKDLRRKR